jgi:hypothetical protein
MMKNLYWYSKPVDPVLHSHPASPERSCQLLRDELPSHTFTLQFAAMYGPAVSATHSVSHPLASGIRQFDAGRLHHAWLASYGGNGDQHGSSIWPVVYEPFRNDPLHPSPSEGADGLQTVGAGGTAGTSG